MSADRSSAELADSHAKDIGALASMTGLPESEVRSVFDTEFARLSSGATVGTYLVVRTLSNVLTILRGRRRLRNGGHPR